MFRSPAAKHSELFSSVRETKTLNAKREAAFCSVVLFCEQDESPSSMLNSKKSSSPLSINSDWCNLYCREAEKVLNGKSKKSLQGLNALDVALFCAGV